MADFIPYSTEELLTLFKQAYYDKTGQPLQIGSDEFAFSAVASYVMRILEQSLSKAAADSLLPTATGAALDGIGATYNIPRYDAAKARVLVSVYNSSMTTNYTRDADWLIVSGGGYTFTNTDAINLTRGMTAQVWCYASEAGAAANGIPAESLSVDTQISEDEPFTFTIEGGSTGGRDSILEINQANDELYRQYILDNINALSIGTARAYEQRALGFSPTIEDVYCVRDGDYIYEQGKAKVFVLFRQGTSYDNVIWREQMLEDLRAYLSADDFKPISDYIMVSTAESVPFNVYNYLYVTIPRQFNVPSPDDSLRTLAQIHYDNAVVEMQRRARSLGFEWRITDFFDLLTTKDESGVYFLTATYQTASSGLRYGKTEGWRTLNISFPTWSDMQDGNHIAFED